MADNPIEKLEGKVDDFGHTLRNVELQVSAIKGQLDSEAISRARERGQMDLTISEHDSVLYGADRRAGLVKDVNDLLSAKKLINWCMCGLYTGFVGLAFKVIGDWIGDK